MAENKPFSILTPRLQLAELTTANAESLFKYRSLPEISRFQGWTPVSVEEAVHFVEEEICHVMNQPDTWFQLGIFLRDEEILVGDLGIHFLAEKSDEKNAGVTNGETDERKNTVELGVTLSPGYQGRGLATEAVNAVIEFLFDTLHKNMVVASIDPENQKSINLVKRSGFQLEGIYKNSVFFRGAWVDDAVFNLTSQQWLNIPKPTL